MAEDRRQKKTLFPLGPTPHPYASFPYHTLPFFPSVRNWCLSGRALCHTWDAFVCLRIHIRTHTAASKTSNYPGKWSSSAPSPTFLLASHYQGTQCQRKLDGNPLQQSGLKQCRCLKIGCTYLWGYANQFDNLKSLLCRSLVFKNLIILA